MAPARRGCSSLPTSVHCSAGSGLCVFGSATRDDFDPSHSDIDFLVEFLPDARSRAFDNFFGLREGLEALLARPIDLLTDRSISNAYLKREIAATRRPLYGA